MAAQGAQDSNASLRLADLFDVKDRVAIVSGAGTGIGLMQAQALAVNGAKVYIVGRTEEKLEKVAELYGKNIDGKIIPLTVDITCKKSITNLVKEFSSREDHLDILMNTAGIAGQSQVVKPGSAEDIRKSLFDNETATFADWDAVYRTNVSHLYFMTIAFLPLLQKGSDKRYAWSSVVINTSSISGIVKTTQDHFAYNASKAGAIHLTKMLAYELSNAGLKIRINQIAPGVFPSEMTAMSSDDKHKSHLPKGMMEGVIPAARPGHDRDMASATIFTATNQYLNGATIVVDGGYILATGAVTV
ncbi:short-chain dehydrogenase [Paecilomyces variotii No. 5]|uniref:Short-chain dehydrogenase n=1 Tax=Byssochlamys spectabilis (strain No. 5 / NBRC 109023) TaxID=1356009 RepID=V5HTQ1_BYSSN|nr:short-chain dehydrogenase [Paecilomyces variotii No. 5]